MRPQEAPEETCNDLVSVSYRCVMDNVRDLNALCDSAHQRTILSPIEGTGPKEVEFSGCRCGRAAVACRLFKLPGDIRCDTGSYLSGKGGIFFVCPPVKGKKDHGLVVRGDR